MSIQHLKDHERDVVRQCIAALRHGRYLDEHDLPTRIGVDFSAYDALLAGWPEIDDTRDESDAALIINNALNEVCHGVHIPDREWPRWFTVPRGAVVQVYQRWARARGWTGSGIR